MTTRATITLKGFGEYLEKVNQAGKDVDQAAAKAVSAGGDVLLDGMLQRVPRRTGKLASTLIRTEVMRDGNFSFVISGMPKDADADVARYGNVQEYGSASTKAHPYIRPTIDEDKGRARTAIRKSLKEDGILNE